MAARNLRKRIRRRRRARRGAKPNLRDRSVFLNIPYDSGFENLFLAYIAGISAFGFTPRATLEIPFGERRLDRILSLIRDVTSIQHAMGFAVASADSGFLTGLSARFGMTRL
jgi:hypothetical protein